MTPVTSGAPGIFRRSLAPSATPGSLAMPASCGGGFARFPSP